jgi:hypothetical protein
MITGAHFLFYSANADADRAFLKDVLELKSVDVGGGWLIFGMPPSEAAVHPAKESFALDHDGTPILGAAVYLICDDLRETMAWLESKKVRCGPIGQASWGQFTSMPLPSGGALGLYQPSHPTMIGKG